MLMMTRFVLVNNQCRILYPVSRCYGKFNRILMQQDFQKFHLSRMLLDQPPQSQIHQGEVRNIKNCKHTPSKWNQDVIIKNLKENFSHTLCVIKNSETTKKVLALAQEKGMLLYNELLRLLKLLIEKIKKFDYKKAQADIEKFFKSDEWKNIQCKIMNFYKAFVLWVQNMIDQVKTTYLSKKTPPKC